MAGSAPAVEQALVVEELVKYFPVPQTGLRAFLNPFAPLTRPALLGVSFQVGAGEVACLIGANGSGKSTLSRILATLLVPTRGRVRVAGYDVERQASHVRAQLGFHSATDGGFYSRLTSRANLNFFAAMNNLFAAEAARRIEELTELMGMAEFIDSQVRTFSTGQVHRLALARAMIHRPSVLLLDEPTRSLDPMAAAEFRRFLKTQVVDRQVQPCSPRRIPWRKWSNLRIGSSCSIRDGWWHAIPHEGCASQPVRPCWKRRSND